MVTWCWRTILHYMAMCYYTDISPI